MKKNTFLSNERHNNSSKTIKRALILALIALLTFASSISVFAVEKKSKNFSKNYTLTGNQALDVISIARAQKNKTKAQLGYKNAWCAAFVLDCARLSGISDSIIPYNYESGGGCGYLYKKLVNDCKAKKITAKEAKSGDIVFYYCNTCKKYVHVGYYDGNGYCIEGNVGGKVLRYNTSYKDSKGHSVSSGTIQRIYLRPNYKISMADCTVTLSKTSFTYTGKAQTPSITVKYGNTKLTNNTHYTYKIANNTNVGTATITLTGKGNYSGTKKVTYTINKINVSSLKYASVNDQAYTGSQIRPSLTVKYGNTTLKNGTHYTLTYGTNKAIGKGRITITGKGIYTGTKTISFNIVPKKVTGLKLSVSKKKMTVSYSKVSGSSGYQIAYRKKGTSKWTTVNVTTTSKKLSLKALTNYQVRVRAYAKLSSGSKVYGNWSSVSTKRTWF